MSKTKEKNEIEYYKGIIRDLKTQVRNLKKQIKQLENKLNGGQKREPKEKVIDNKLLCPNCGKAELEIHDFKYVTFTKCKLCGFKEKL